MRAGGDYRHPRRVRRVLCGLIPVVCPAEGHAAGLEEAIVDHAELSMGAMPAAVRGALVTGLYAYDAGAVMRHGRGSYRLDGDRARRYFAAWYEGPAFMRQFAKGVKGLLCLACYEMPQVQESLAYRPDAWIDKVARRRLATYGEDIAHHLEQRDRPDPLVDSRAPAGAQAHRGLADQEEQ